MATDPGQRPNIVFINTDQMRGDCLGVTGHPVVQTPNLDALARRGCVFTAAYSACPSCIAARASWFTGQRPTTTGRLGYRDGVPWRYESTLAQVLSDAGYQTHSVGKTHFFPQRLHMGFHSMDSYEGRQQLTPGYVNDYHEWLEHETGGRLREWDHGLAENSWCARPSHLPEELHVNTWTVTRSVEFLRRRDPTRPFFLSIGFHRPHAPVDPPRTFFDLYRDAELPAVPVGDWAGRHDVPPNDVNSAQGRLAPAVLALLRRAYYAQVAHIDNQIGRLLMDLGRHGPTCILFTADHGEMLGDHHLFRKTYAYEGSARTPLILAAPSGAERHTSHAPISQQDIMPTLLDAAGVDIPSSVEGRSFLPLLRRSAEEVGWREYVHGEHSPCYFADSGMQYLTDGLEKYVWYTESGREEFFDLRSDPEETRNLAANPAARERLELWRSRMVDELAPREQDGMSDGTRLVPGARLPAVRPELLEG